MSRARRQQYMLRTEASEQEAVITASLYIEMKYGDGRLQKEQKEFLKQAADYGNFVAVCYSQEIALKVIEDYVTLKTGEIMPIENNQVLKRWEEKKWQK